MRRVTCLLAFVLPLVFVGGAWAADEPAAKLEQVWIQVSGVG